MTSTKSLREIVSAIPGRISGSELDVRVESLEYDVRKVKRGSVYFALSGTARDGHSHIADALDRGAVAVVYERRVFRPPKGISLQVPDSRAALSQASAIFYGAPERKLKVFGVTGGEARSSAAFFLRSILQDTGTETGLVGRIADEYCGRWVPKYGTEPEVLDVRREMVRMASGGCKACVFETGLRWRTGWNGAVARCDTAVFVHGMESQHGIDQFRCRTRDVNLASFLPKSDSGVFESVVYDMDDSAAAYWGRSVKAREVITYGKSRGAVVQLLESSLHNSGTRVKLRTPSGVIIADVPVFHRDDLLGLLGAVGAVVGLKIPLSALKFALGTLRPVPGRLEMVDCGQPFRVCVDSSRSISGLAKALVVLRQTGRGRLLLVFGAGADHTSAERIELGKLAGRLADHVIVTSDNPGYESPEKIAAEIVCGIKQAALSSYETECNRRTAIIKAVRMAKRGDTVLIAGKGYVTYQVVLGAVIPFDDRVYAREGLERLGYCCEADYLGV